MLPFILSLITSFSFVIVAYFYVYRCDCASMHHTHALPAYESQRGSGVTEDCGHPVGAGN